MKFILSLILLTISFYTYGSEFQQWVPVNINVKLNENVRGTLEVQARIDDLQTFNTGIIRPAIGYKLNDNWTLWGGYAMQLQHTDTNVEIENRSFEGITYKTGDVSTFEVRNRIEQRFLPQSSSNSDISHRYRMRVKAEFKTEKSSPLSLITSSEVFVNLNDDNNLNQVRTYAGVGYRFNPNSQVETGYLHQLVISNTTDKNNNIWMTSFNFNF